MPVTVASKKFKIVMFVLLRIFLFCAEDVDNGRGVSFDFFFFKRAAL